jgi:hypothetical protein
VPAQTIHEDDAAAAIAFVLGQDLPGTFNVAADDSVAAPDEIFGQRRVVLPLDKAGRVLDRTAPMGLSPPGAEIAVLMYPQVMSNAALKTAGFAPRHSSRAALEAAAAARHRVMTVGRFSVNRRNAIMVGAIGLVAVVSAVGRRRARRVRG